MDSLEPEFILGSNVQMKKKKKKLSAGSDEKPTKKKHKIVGHTKPVLDLSHNKLNRGVMASGSADKSIVLWDLEKLQQATKIKNHTAKVQSIKFHPIESFSLLSGSADQTVVLYDCRNPKVNNKKWSFSGEIEQVLWNHQEPNQFIVRFKEKNTSFCQND
jgi:periodic tryptophan protein 1